MVVQASSVLWLHNVTCEACVCCALCQRVLSQGTAHTGLTGHIMQPWNWQRLYDHHVPTWTKCVILAKRWLAPWWWFPCKLKLILICFNKLYMCINWIIKGLISLMHGITMKIIWCCSNVTCIDFICASYMMLCNITDCLDLGMQHHKS